MITQPKRRYVISMAATHPSVIKGLQAEGAKNGCVKIEVDNLEDSFEIVDAFLDKYPDLNETNESKLSEISEKIASFGGIAATVYKNGVCRAMHDSKMSPYGPWAIYIVDKQCEFDATWLAHNLKGWQAIGDIDLYPGAVIDGVKIADIPKRYYLSVAGIEDWSDFTTSHAQAVLDQYKIDSGRPDAQVFKEYSARESDIAADPQLDIFG